MYRSITRHTTKCGAERICGADLNGDNLRTSIGPVCGSVITVGLRLELGFGSGLVTVRVRIKVRVRVRFGVANCCCIQIVGEGGKMRINHVIKTDQCRCAPQIRHAPHIVVSRRPITHRRPDVKHNKKLS